MSGNWSNLFDEHRQEVVTDEIFDQEIPTKQLKNLVITQAIGPRVKFVNIDVSYLVVRGKADKKLKIQGVEFLTCKNDNKGEKIFFEHCETNSIVFSGSTGNAINKKRFINCNFQNLSFNDARLNGVEFIDCEFDEWTISQGSMLNCHFLNCKFDNLISSSETFFENVTFTNSEKKSRFRTEYLPRSSQGEYGNNPFEWNESKNDFLGYGENTQSHSTNTASSNKSSNLHEANTETVEKSDPIEETKISDALNNFESQKNNSTQYSSANSTGNYGGSNNSPVFAFRDQLYEQKKTAACYLLWSSCFLGALVVITTVYCAVLYAHFVYPNKQESWIHTLDAQSKFFDFVAINAQHKTTTGITPSSFNSSQSSLQSATTTSIQPSSNSYVSSNNAPIIYNGVVSSNERSNHPTQTATVLNNAFGFLIQMDQTLRWQQSWIRVTIGLILLALVGFAKAVQKWCQSTLDHLNAEVLRVDVMIMTYTQVLRLGATDLIKETLHDIRKAFYANNIPEDKVDATKTNSSASEIIDAVQKSLSGLLDILKKKA